MKNLFLFLAIFLAIPLSSLAFSDVPTTHRFSEEIKFVQDKGIVGGYADGTFKPESTINRAEFTKIIISSLYTKEEIENCDTTKFSFPDVPKTEWYAKFVCLAKKNGIINGYADGKFLPNGTITLPEALKILLESYKVDINSYTDGLVEEFWYDRYLYTSQLFFTNGKFPIMEKMKVGGATFEKLGVLEYKISRSEMAYLITQLPIFLDSQQLQMAYDKKDLKLCEGLYEKGFEIGCKDNIYYQIASDAKDPAKCDKLSDEYTQKSCKSQIVYIEANETNDVKKCDAILDETYKTSCKDQFFYTQASNEKNPEKCKMMTDTSYKSACFNDTYYNNAYETKNEALCDKISDFSMQSDCKKNVRFLKKQERSTSL